MSSHDPQTPQQRRDAEIAETRMLNETGLMRVMLEHGLVLPRQGKDWRPTQRTRGHIAGLEHVGTLEILCTDGVVAYFASADNKTFYGHIQKFSGKVKPLYSLPPASTATSAKRAPDATNASVPKPKKPSTLERALDMLRKMTQPGR